MEGPEFINYHADGFYYIRPPFKFLIRSMVI